MRPYIQGEMPLPANRNAGVYVNTGAGHAIVMIGNTFDPPKHKAFQIPPRDRIATAIQIARARQHFRRMGWDNYATGWTTGDVDYY